MNRHGLLRSLGEYRMVHPNESDEIARFERFVNGEPNCFQRNCWSGHVTGSAWVVDAQGLRVLLTHHRKLGRWLQLGGHCDGDSDVLRVACREAAEESGLTVAPVSEALFDLDIHFIPARKDEPAHHHFDARFAVRALGSEERLRVSDESHDLRWVGIDDLAAFTTEPSMLRMAEKWTAVRYRYNW